MSDDLRNRCPTREDQINLTDRWEIEYWIRKFDTNEHDLRNAIQIVGTSATKVSEQLKH
jgi:hypothetical protein